MLSEALVAAFAGYGFGIISGWAAVFFPLNNRLVLIERDAVRRIDMKELEIKISVQLGDLAKDIKELTRALDKLGVSFMKDTK